MITPPFFFLNFVHLTLSIHIGDCTIDMKEEVNLRIEYDLLLNKKLILLLACL